MPNVKRAQIRQLRSAEDAAGLRICLMGPITVENDGKPLAIASRKARALLGYLVQREGIETARSTLTGLLWGERSEAQARASLRQTLSELRGALTPSSQDPILANKESVAWAPGSAWIDTRELASATTSEDEEALRKAALLMRGEFLEGLSIDEATFEHWLAGERERYRQLASTIHSRLMDRAESSGDLEAALNHGLKLISFDPLQEQVHRSLMRLYAAHGRHDAALAQYERCKSELSNQLGVSPDLETEALLRSIRTSRRDRSVKAQNAPAIVPVGRQEERLALPDRPSIAVLPFTSIGADEDSGYFAEGVADDIITELSRNKDLFVVARHSSFHIASQEHDPAAISQALGVRHLLAGSVRRSDERLRLSLHLIEGKSGNEVWAERYDRGLADLFEIQLEVARIVTSTIAGRLTALAGEAAASKAPGNFAAYDHVLRAQQYLQRYTRPDYARAREHLEAAIRVDPFYARPYGLLCMAGVYDWFWEMSEDGLADVVGMGEKALALDDQDAKAHMALAVAHLFTRHYDRAVHHIERAIALNPNDDLVVVNHGRILCGAGQPEEGVLRVREAMRLNPYHPNWYWNIEGLCLHHIGRYEEAIAAYHRIDVPQFWVEAYLAACHAMCGRDERAAYHRKRLFAMYPDFNLTVFRRGLPGRYEPQRFLDTFRRAGLKD